MKNSLQTKNYKLKTNCGFTLLIAIITTSMLLIVSFVVVNIALKQLVLASAARESQYAFYAADSGTECAVYWDLVDSALSKFATTTAGTIDCNGKTIYTDSQTGPTNIQTGTGAVPTIPSQNSLIGGGGVSHPTSIFWLQFPKGCAIVRVTKAYRVIQGVNTLTTEIDSRGYNSCDVSVSRRYERGVTLAY